jgi:hypothetical protein
MGMKNQDLITNTSNFFSAPCVLLDLMKILSEAFTGAVDKIRVT